MTSDQNHTIIKLINQAYDNTISCTISLSLQSTFQLSFTLLVCYRFLHQYYKRNFGRNIPPIFMQNFRPTLLVWFISLTVNDRNDNSRLSLALVALSRRIKPFLLLIYWGDNQVVHIPKGIHHEYIGFQSPLLTESQLISFPELTNMLKFSP